VECGELEKGGRILFIKLIQMDELIREIEKLKKGKVGKTVEKRIKEFKKLGQQSSDKIFKELCFCLLTANYDAQKAINIQNKIQNGFIEYPQNQLSDELKKLGYRFPNVRSKFIAEARKHKENLKKIICSCKTDMHRREWFAENVKGLGYKEASHFLRNIGHPDCAIIDFHIIDILVRNKIIKEPKTLSKKVYLEIEKILSVMAKKLKISLAELDLYLWYMETGKILK